MTDSKLIIQNPCAESWDEMKPTENGRHCSSCRKTVVNFSEMSKEDIKAYFQSVSGEKVCGYFDSKQVVVQRPKHHQYLIDLYNSIEQKVSIPLLKKIPLYCILFCLFLVGCKSKSVTGELPLKGKAIKNKKTDVKMESTTGMPFTDYLENKIVNESVTVATYTTVGDVDLVIEEDTITGCESLKTVGMPIPEKLAPIIMGEPIQNIQIIGDTIIKE